ncbi:MAG: preprotein translocase subunit SecA [Gammaproteobacteria bacterium]|nr:MAG: preprotein translocase subunit SecA [Gammaproteobacteria bacterium]
MVKKLIKKVFGSRNDRLVKVYAKKTDKILSFESEFIDLSDEEIPQKTADLKQQLKDGSPLDDLLPAAFSLVKEASKRSLKMAHFDVQMIGGMVLNDGKIAEMKTGEGKTLMATLAVYLNALSGNGVHVVTVNDYLAKRDAAWMGQLYNFLGMSVGVITANLSHEQKKQAYNCDITYGTNNEFGFDYLRDNMAFSKDEKVQRQLNFAIVDEVDSILIDEARTPLIISGPVSDNTELYQKINKLVPKLNKQTDKDSDGDFSVDEKHKQVLLSEAGHEKLEQLLLSDGLIKEGESLYDPSHISLMHHTNAALRAHNLFFVNTDYVINDSQIVIVDEFTGRTMEGRRWSDGLHQAIEAKENITIQKENQTLASITFQNYFRLYNKLSGMTGTADTEAFEFQSIYGLEVVVIPTNQPMLRADKTDLVYLTFAEKFQAISDDIKSCVKRGQPVLVGTTSIENSEVLSQILTKQKIRHEVLNAKQHQREALIIANAGCLSSVTIATNMAGRGTDIVLGGNVSMQIEQLKKKDNKKIEQLKNEWQDKHNQVVTSGGLHIIGTERHESRRIDNQLRGRSGRQGDPGSSRFYLSLEDPLMRIFASEKVSSLMQKLGMEDGEAIEHPWVARAIENAQRKVEAHNFDIRKNLLEYDDVANDQRKVIYDQRNILLQSDNINKNITSMRKSVIDSAIDDYIPPSSIPEQWDIENLQEICNEKFALNVSIADYISQNEKNQPEDIANFIIENITKTYSDKFENVDQAEFYRFEKEVMLQQLDTYWKEHLSAMDYLRQSIGLRSYAQKNPTQEYKKESFAMFSQLLDKVKFEVTSLLSLVKVQSSEQINQYEQNTNQDIDLIHQKTQNMGMNQNQANQERNQSPFVRKQPKIGRNEPCHCGSGKKYKKCHGKLI